MGYRTFINFENFDFKLLNTINSHNGKRAFVMMSGTFYHRKSYFGHRIDININNDSKWKFFRGLNNRMKQLTGYDYGIINEYGMVELMASLADESMFCKFKERVNGTNVNRDSFSGCRGAGI